MGHFGGMILIAVGIFLVLLAAGLSNIFIWFGFKRPAKRRQFYTGQAEGTVERMSNIYSSDIRVPLVRYEVNGTEYKVAGPRFAGVTVKTLEIGDSQILRSSSNITAEGELPLVVHAKGDLSAAQAAMEERYPAGCTVPVFYDPRNPKKSFVERDAPISKRFTVIMLCICGLLALTGLVLAFIGICAMRK